MFKSIITGLALGLGGYMIWRYLNNSDTVTTPDGEGVGWLDGFGFSGGSDGFFGVTYLVDDLYKGATGERLMSSNWMQDLSTRGAPYVGDLLAAEAANGIPPYLLARLAWQESRFRPDIISGQTKSSAGAVGIMQIVPKWHPGVNAYDAKASIAYAGKYLKSLYNQFGTWELALKAYNWGQGNVRKWLQGQLNQPLETKNYSAQILADVKKYSGNNIA